MSPAATKQRWRYLYIYPDGTTNSPIITKPTPHLAHYYNSSWWNHLIDLPHLKISAGRGPRARFVISYVVE